MQLRKAIPDQFHRLFASWLRIEPRCRDDDFAPGLEAGAADPLWMIGRNWQVGELTGEDAASPVAVKVSYQNDPLDGLDLGARNPTGEFDEIPAGLPLEAVIEREAVEWDWRKRIRTGQQFERIVRRRVPADADAVVSAYRAAFPVAPPAEEDLSIDRASARFLAVVAGRAIDGQALWEAIHGSVLPYAPMTADELAVVAGDLAEWLDRLYSQPSEELGSAWEPNRLSYRFRVRAAGDSGRKVELGARSYRNGELDWYSCSLESVTDGGSDGPMRVLAPTRVRFGGMPHPRWWAFEDGEVDFGNIETAITDPARLMLMQFALLAADDWFVVPLKLPTGSVTRIASLHVTDVFGDTTSIPPAWTPGANAVDRWELFNLAWAERPRAEGERSLLLLPPATGYREESPPLEEVRFIRDEGANMVWGIEHTAPDALGTPVSAFDLHVERRERAFPPPPRDGGNGAAPTARPASELPHYWLATQVPPNWIPFLPVRVSQHPPQNALVRGRMLLNEADTEPCAITGVGRLLADDEEAPALIFEEETIPRAGLRVQLTAQRTRGPDGGTYVWLGRKVLTGRGDGSSGLRFDVVE